MPLVKGAVSLAAGATSDAILTGTTYEYIANNVSIRVAAGTDQAAAADGSSVVMNFTMNNTELTKNGAVSTVVTGEPFGANGNYVMNSTVTPPTLCVIGRSLHLQTIPPVRLWCSLRCSSANGTTNQEHHQ